MFDVFYASSDGDVSLSCHGCKRRIDDDDDDDHDDDGVYDFVFV